jgi:hypothetical protein
MCARKTCWYPKKKKHAHNVCPNACLELVSFRAGQQPAVLAMHAGDTIKPRDPEASKVISSKSFSVEKKGYGKSGSEMLLDCCQRILMLVAWHAAVVQ